MVRGWLVPLGESGSPMFKKPRTSRTNSSLQDTQQNQPNFGEADSVVTSPEQSWTWNIQEQRTYQEALKKIA